MDYIPVSSTLIQRIRNIQDQDAWREFYEMYSPIIIGFSRINGCSEDVSRDILQETMCTLMRIMPGYEFRPGEDTQPFRLMVLGVVEARIRLRDGGDIGGEDAAGGRELATDSSPFPAREQVDHIWSRYLMYKAVERLYDRLDPLSWATYVMYVLDGRRADEVAKALSVGNNVVFQHKNIVTRKIREEVKIMKSVIGDLE